jgi:hypothetical protein
MPIQLCPVGSRQDWISDYATIGTPPGLDASSSPPLSRLTRERKLNVVATDTSQITESGHFLRKAVTSCMRRVAGYHSACLDERCSIPLRNRLYGVGGGVAGVFRGHSGPTRYIIKLVFGPRNRQSAPSCAPT